MHRWAEVTITVNFCCCQTAECLQRLIPIEPSLRLCVVHIEDACGMSSPHPLEFCIMTGPDEVDSISAEWLFLHEVEFMTKINTHLVRHVTKMVSKHDFQTVCRKTKLAREAALLHNAECESSLRCLRWAIAGGTWGELRVGHGDEAVDPLAAQFQNCSDAPNVAT